jgi:hypothetical protein
VADLLEQIDRAFGRHRSRTSHERIGVEAFEELHHVEESPVVGHAEIEQLDAMRRSQARDRLSFTLEAPSCLV